MEQAQQGKPQELIDRREIREVILRHSCDIDRLGRETIRAGYRDDAADESAPTEYGLLPPDALHRTDVSYQRLIKVHQPLPEKAAAQ